MFLHWMLLGRTDMSRMFRKSALSYVKTHYVFAFKPPLQHAETLLNATNRTKTPGAWCARHQLLTPLQRCRNPIQGCGVRTQSSSWAAQSCGYTLRALLQMLLWWAYESRCKSAPSCPESQGFVKIHAFCCVQHVVAVTLHVEAARVFLAC